MSILQFYSMLTAYKAFAIRHINPDVLTLLASYGWPGNVRELFHTLDYVLNVIDDDTIRAAEELGLHRQGMQYRIKKYGIIV